jgi:predicted phosphoribosyltransferase
MTPFADRDAAGRALAERVRDSIANAGVVVLGLPRGGVVVAARVAERLGAPLDVLVARKLRTPGRPELAMGAIAVWGRHVATVHNTDVITHLAVAADAVDAEHREQVATALQRAARWNQVDPDAGRYDVVLVDDGLATGATMHAAVEVARHADVGRIVVAVPVGAPRELARLADRVDAVVALGSPRQFASVGAYYDDFSEVDDSTVDRELAAARERAAR